MGERVFYLDGKNVKLRRRTAEETKLWKAEVARVAAIRAKCKHRWVNGQCAKCAEDKP